ncbi:MAG: hypothetical protein HYX22_01870 [Candidatus Yanofskybacteria bacterium]|nr:hypothetical protein [Candidatus Yanofskybacteria bacterium]
MRQKVGWRALFFFFAFVFLNSSAVLASARQIPEVNEKAAREYQKKLDEQKKQKQQERENNRQENEQEPDQEAAKPAEKSQEEICRELLAEKCRQLLEEERQKTQPPSPIFPVEPDLHDTYFKAGLVNNTGELFQDRLNNGFGYSLNSLRIDIETHFDSRHLFIFYGWSFGYRKEDVRKAESGHFLNFKTFSRFDMDPFYVKFGPGIEWGMPGTEFDQTEFVYDGKHNLLRYDHVFLERNFWIPNSEKFHKAGVLYPTVDLAGGFRNSHFILEAGLMWNVYRFGIQSFDLTTNGFQVEKRFKMLPGFVVSAGFAPY